MIHGDISHHKNPTPKSREINSVYASIKSQYSKPNVFVDAVILLLIFALGIALRINKAFT